MIKFLKNSRSGITYLIFIKSKRLSIEQTTIKNTKPKLYKFSCIKENLGKYKVGKKMIKNKI